MGVSRLVNRNICAERGRTSMRLEPELWEALREIAAREGEEISALVRRVEANAPIGGRTSAVRVFVVGYFREAATEAGHIAAGHGARMRLIARGEHSGHAAGHQPDNLAALTV